MARTSLRDKFSNIAFLSRICLRKPVLAARLVSGFLRNRLLKQRRLRFMDIAIDYRCNMTCTHCSATNFERQDTSPLSHSEFSRVAEELYREGCLIYHFTGGEPLLRDDLEELIRLFKPHRSLISIQSNGLLATPERLRSLRKAGADIFNVSIDSGFPEENDRFRNMPGAFDKAIRAVDAAQEAGFMTSVSTCISKSNLGTESLQRIIDITAEKGIWCYFNLAVPIGRWQDCGDFMLDEADQKDWRILEERYPHCRVDLKSNWSEVGCGAVKEKGYLSAYGDILTCPFIHVALGNIRDETISAIRTRALQVPEFARYWPRCLAAEERTFIEKTPCYNDWKGEYPIPFRQIPWMMEYMDDTKHR